MKHCNKCGKTKPLEEFYRSTRNKDERQSLCKPCDVAYRAANADKIKVRNAVYRAANADKIKAYDTAYRAANPDKVAACRAANPDQIRARNAKRRALKRNANVVELVIPAVVYKRDGWKCHLCKKIINRRRRWPDPMSPSVDHLVPLSKGGDHSYLNVAAAHLGCNVKRNNSGRAQLRLLG